MDIQDLPRRSPGAIVSSQMHFLFSFRNVLAVSHAKNFVCMTGVKAFLALIVLERLASPRALISLRGPKTPTLRP
jgi:hypothetical protein